MKKNLIRSYAIMFVGAFTIGIGAAFIIYGNLGGDAMSTFEQGLVRTFPISLPVSQIIANMLFAAALFLLDRKRVNLDTILCPLCISFGCSVISRFISETSVMTLQYVYLFVGIVICSAGIGIGAQTESGSNPYDGMILALSEKLNIKFSLLRPIFDGILLVVAIILKGSFGIGTIIATFALGPIANVFIKTFSFIKEK